MINIDRILQTNIPDIALCTYWMFYAADKGIAPPLILGYRQEYGHDTSNIMYVLNSIYE